MRINEDYLETIKDDDLVSSVIETEEEPYDYNSILVLQIRNDITLAERDAYSRRFIKMIQSPLINHIDELRIELDDSLDLLFVYGNNGKIYINRMDFDGCEYDYFQKENIIAIGLDGDALKPKDIIRILTNLIKYTYDTQNTQLLMTTVYIDKPAFDKKDVKYHENVFESDITDVDRTDTIWEMLHMKEKYIKGEYDYSEYKKKVENDIVDDYNHVQDYRRFSSLISDLCNVKCQEAKNALNKFFDLDFDI